MVSYVHVSIIIIQTRASRGVYRVASSLTNQLEIIHTTSDGNQGEIVQCDTFFRGEKLYTYNIYAYRKQRASPQFAESRNRDECTGDRLPVARVT